MARAPCPALESERPRIRAARTSAALLLLAVLALVVGHGVRRRSGRRLEYNRDVRPILAENCFPCHGPDSAARKADLRLDQREAAIEAGAIAPGDAESSELIARINAADPKEVMPPPSTTKTLSQKQKDVLQAVDRRRRRLSTALVAHPPQASRAAEGARIERGSAIRSTRFVLAKLEENGLSPAPEADRRTLARRLSLDLTGLPPDPADVESFVERPLARCLRKAGLAPAGLAPLGRASRPLLARRRPLRRYQRLSTSTISAKPGPIATGSSARINRNLPSTGSPIEQLAGDLLPGSTLEQQVASGFNRCNMTTNEGGSIPEEYQVLYTRDRTEAVSQVWLGLTTGCAVCHDHKFDPISQREFYELSAFFNNTTQPVMDGNIKDTPPTVFVPSAADQAALAGPARRARRRSETARRPQSSRPGRLHEMAGRGRSQAL